MRPTRDNVAIDDITDVFGEAWIVRDLRATTHGFPVATGWPAEAGRRGEAIILTASLAEYLMAVERPRDIDLPIGGTAIKRLRAALRLRFDWDTWWHVRRDDLLSTTLEQFSQRHHCSIGAASQRRAALWEQDRI